MKRLLSLLLLCLLLLSLAPAALADGDPEPAKLVAVTFDDGPGPYTSRLLDGLEDRGAKVTFFMLGSCAERYREIVERAYLEGHQIASHTYSHTLLTKLSAAGIKDEISSTAAVLDAATGTSGRYYLRPPYGGYNSTVLSLAGAPVIYWSVDTLDWKYRNADTVYRNILDAAHDGSIVLLHDIHATSVDGALRAIDTLIDRGYELVTVSELLRRKGVSPEEGVVYFNCREATQLPPVSAPVIAADPVIGGVKISMKADPGAAILYTTDGQDPLYHGTAYREAFTLASSCTVRAIAAFDLNGGRSAEASLDVAVSRAPAPEFILNGGLVLAAGKEVMRYTTDGSDPSADSPFLDAPLELPRGAELRAASFAPGYTVSPTALLTCTPAGHFLTDVRLSDWFTGAVDAVLSRGLMEADAQLRFRPGDAVTRAEAVDILYRLAGRPEPPLADWPLFSDTDNTPALLWACGSGVAAGCGDGAFRPGDPLTREQFATLYYGFLRASGAALPEPSAFTFSDVGDIDEYALVPLGTMVALGVLHGDPDGALAPLSPLTRAQLAAILSQLPGSAEQP